MSLRIGPCRQCGGDASWITCPTGGWWAHDIHPGDNHRADLDPMPEWMDDDGIIHTGDDPYEVTS